MALADIALRTPRLRQRPQPETPRRIARWHTAAEARAHHRMLSDSHALTRFAVLATAIGGCTALAVLSLLSI